MAVVDALSFGVFFRSTGHGFELRRKLADAVIIALHVVCVTPPLRVRILSGSWLSVGDDPKPNERALHGLCVEVSAFAFPVLFSNPLGEAYAGV